MKRRKVRVRFYPNTATSSGSKVQLGVVEETGDIYLRLTDTKGRETKLALSREAMDLIHRQWLSWLEFESKRERYAYVMMSVVRRLPPAAPWAYAGIPPAEDPTQMRFTMNDSRWRWAGAAGISPPILQEQP